MSGLELDPVLLQRRLHHLATAVSRLESFKSVTLEQLEQGESIDWAVLYGLQTCIQAVLDISAHLVAASGSAVTDSYRSGLLALGRLGILPQEFAQRIADMAGFRNILVHDYLDVDMAVVKRILDEQLDDFKEFGQHVERYMARDAD